MATRRVSRSRSQKGSRRQRGGLNKAASNAIMNRQNAAAKREGKEMMAEMALRELGEEPTPEKINAYIEEVIDNPVATVNNTRKPKHSWVAGLTRKLLGVRKHNTDRSKLVQMILTNDADKVKAYLEPLRVSSAREGKGLTVKNMLNTVENEKSGKTPIVFTVTKGSKQCVKFNPELYKLLRKYGAKHLKDEDWVGVGNSVGNDKHIKGLDTYARECGVLKELRQAECEFAKENNRDRNGRSSNDKYFEPCKPLA